MNHIYYMIKRKLQKQLKYYSNKMPVISVTGPRQSGKSTLTKNTFPEYSYVNLEDIELRTFAISDPKGFLEMYPYPLIIDEAQYAPVLFSYIQVIADEDDKNGMYILTGSQDFLLSKSISQSLAGRVATLHLLPFSIKELEKTEYKHEKWENYCVKGFYPRIYDKQLDYTKWYSDYVKTYIERDVRDITQIGDLRTFRQFLSLCAGRIGQIINLSSVGGEIGVSYQTIKRWISILETTNIITLLQPYFKNFNKRVVKSPKLYFNDTGLASYLLGIKSNTDYNVHFSRGALFENLIISEFFKEFYNKGEEPHLFYWRDSAGNEVDLIIENGINIQAIEIKSAKTFNSDFVKGLNNFVKVSNTEKENCFIVYGGNTMQKRDNIKVLPWGSCTNIVK